jgi:four helix bundle protein
MVMNPRNSTVIVLPSSLDGTVRDFRTLQAWQRAHALTLAAHQLTKTFPRGERYGLTSQINRAAASVGANLAEGCGSVTDGEFAQFVRIALRSASELEYHLLLARDLNLTGGPAYEGAASEVVQVKRMMTGLLKKLSAQRSRPSAALPVAPDR